MLKPSDAVSARTAAAKVPISHFDAGPAPAFRARRVKIAAPPPTEADKSAMSWDTLVNEPTTSSGEGMARTGVVPRTNAAAAPMAHGTRERIHLSDKAQRGLPIHIPLPASDRRTH